HLPFECIQGAMYLFMTGAIFITIFRNLAIIISISYFKQLHSPTNFLILSMAVTDFLLGFTVMPYSMVRSVENCWYFGITLCKIHYSFDLMLCVTSIFHLCSIAVDGFYAICYPLHYSICWSVPAAFAFRVSFSEVYASRIEGYQILVACSSLCHTVFNKLWGTVLFKVGFFTPCCVMLGIYVKIFLVSKKQAHVMSSIPENANHEKPNQLSKNKDRKAAKTLSIVMRVFLICWFPCFITVLIDPFLNFSPPALLFDALTWCGYFNSTCNPLIYVFCYPWVQKAVRYILDKIFQTHFNTARLFPENQKCVWL
uniref:G-protein coupled receptors family 1 profile domain-containing protein n=1 Tax=Chelonoidis abingdonii TaxID=106734 RepID=A0A8C0GPN6_CHEAB